jgi:hypothetical protein
MTLRKLQEYSRPMVIEVLEKPLIERQLLYPTLQPSPIKRPTEIETDSLPRDFRRLDLQTPDLVTDMDC